MRVEHHAGALNDIEADLAIVGAYAGEPLPAVAAGLVEANDFQGTFKKTLLLYGYRSGGQVEVSERGGTQPAPAQIAAPRLLLVGLGRRDELTPERLRQATAAAAKQARELPLSHIAVEVPQHPTLAAADAAQAAAEGLLLALYRFDQFKGAARKKDETPPAPVERITVAGDGDGVAESLQLVETLYRGVKLARDLGNEPPRVCTPTRLAGVAEEIAARGGFELTVLDRPQMEELGMGGLLGVAEGTAEPPKFIVLEYGSKGQGKTIALVGKGITFDSGGISIKPGEKMDAMKMDMMGAGAVLGAMSVLADLKPANVHVVGIVASTENLPSGTAFVPGDILTAMNGVTMEILNTDAEGRLVLADGLSYAQRYEPDAIVDLATLTGGVVIALGHHIAGLVTNNPELAARVKAAAEKTGELVWELPLLPEYRKAVKSKVADIRNTAGRAASTITGGAFLENFVDGRPWVHLDIAGTASGAEEPKPYWTDGATGFGVRLLVELVRQFAQA
ncbi:MAG TPA: leucyl aminopeptidase [Herpetosiphonaceae bacterium]|nr:leucyl aminopeptidase [Herpetosiphonaceae bacterium]